MKTPSAGFLPRYVSAVRLGLADRLIGPVFRLPIRLREWRFWHVQVLVIIATVPHYAIESSGDAFPTLESWQLNSLTISLYILPLLYAALHYSWEGAVLTALWAGALTSPSIWFWHRSSTHWATEMGQLMVVLPVGILVAWRVDLEKRERRKAEVSEQKYRNLFENAGDAILVCDASGRIDAANAAAAGLTGYRVKQLTALSILELFDRKSADALNEAGERLAGGLLVEGRLQLHLKKKDGAEVIVEAACATFVDDTGARAMQAVLRDVTAERERQQRLQSYVRQVTRAQEEERKRIARELHDDTAQALVLLYRRIDSLIDSGQRPSKAILRRLEGLRTLCEDTLASVRRFSRDLRPSTLDDLGLIPSIEWLISDVAGRSGIDVRLEVRENVPKLADETRVALFRVVQEALRNVERHSGASEVTVALRFGEKRLQIEVRDNGKGFEVPKMLKELATSGRLGVLGMEERAQLLGGTFSVWSRPGEGTCVAVEVDLDDSPGGDGARPGKSAPSFESRPWGRQRASRRPAGRAPSKRSGRSRGSP